MLSVVAAIAAAQDGRRDATVVFSGQPIVFSSSAERHGDECFIPLAEAGKLGWNASIRGTQARVVVAGKSVDTFTRKGGATTFIPVRAVIASAGGFTEWTTDTTLTIYSEVKRIAVTLSGVEVDLAGPAGIKVFTLDSPPRVVVDVLGARMHPDRKPAATGDMRMSQFDPNTVRIVAQTSSLIIPQGGMTPEGSIRVFWTGARSVPPEPYKPGPAVVVPMTVGTPVVATDEDDETLIRIPFQGGTPGSFAVRRDPAGIHWVNLPTARLAPNAQMAELTARSLKSGRLIDRPGGGLALRFELQRPMGIHVAANGPDLVVRISRPKNSGGGLAEKIIVVDAGHGGKDPGANWGTLLEKDINLDIARHVGRLLAEEGATVVMTREDDTFIELNDRPGMANAGGAHLFISIHSNSNRVVNSTSGTFTYYHMQDPDSRALAECIQAEVVKVTGLPDHGARSDSEVYKQGGFAVLRHSRMPAILLEVAYINHEIDRAKLMDPEFRRRVAQGVVRGIEVYIGNEAKRRG